MVTSWGADEFPTLIKLVPAYLCITWVCRTAVSQSETSTHTDCGVRENDESDQFYIFCVHLSSLIQSCFDISSQPFILKKFLLWWRLLRQCYRQNNTDSKTGMLCDDLLILFNINSVRKGTETTFFMFELFNIIVFFKYMFILYCLISFLRGSLLGL